jgi:hypothetical protein
MRTFVLRFQAFVRIARLIPRSLGMIFDRFFSATASEMPARDTKRDTKICCSKVYDICMAIAIFKNKSVPLFYNAIAVKNY